MIFPLPVQRLLNKTSERDSDEGLERALGLIYNYTAEFQPGAPWLGCCALQSEPPGTGAANYSTEHCFLSLALPPPPHAPISFGEGGLDSQGATYPDVCFL